MRQCIHCHACLHTQGRAGRCSWPAACSDCSLTSWHCWQGVPPPATLRALQLHLCTASAVRRAAAHRSRRAQEAGTPTATPGGSTHQHCQHQRVKVPRAAAPVPQAGPAADRAVPAVCTGAGLHPVNKLRVPGQATAPEDEPALCMRSAWVSIACRRPPECRSGPPRGPAPPRPRRPWRVRAPAPAPVSARAGAARQPRRSAGSRALVAARVPAPRLEGGARARADGGRAQTPRPARPRRRRAARRSCTTGCRTPASSLPQKKGQLPRMPRRGSKLCAGSHAHLLLPRTTSYTPSASHTSTNADSPAALPRRWRLARRFLHASCSKYGLHLACMMWCVGTAVGTHGCPHAACSPWRGMHGDFACVDSVSRAM